MLRRTNLASETTLVSKMKQEIWIRSLAHKNQAVTLEKNLGMKA
jgi:hypothetical protein